ncbi:hypothetical protein LWC35_29370 [Pseudonocardia kujensis]|uniref:hypothetical protein n=1 Tax=Pseudonocardia kujensis TaxID=1128675 RepID=UPI001E651F51|nr:hypothetical protein [Pseudonocardia kujensis]MCE0766987.1 hypothetical protein [Pseudonocardia kujensis]
MTSLMMLVDHFAGLDDVRGRTAITIDTAGTLRAAGDAVMGAKANLHRTAMTKHQSLLDASGTEGARRW